MPGQIDSSQAQVPAVSYLRGSGGLIIGGHYGQVLTGEIGYIKSNVTKIKDYRKDVRDSSEKIPFWGEQPYSAVSIGSEFFATKDNKLAFGPKIGFDYSLFFIFHLRVNATYYTDLANKTDLRISPAFGLSLGFVNLMYNFNYPLLKDHFENLATNRLSLIFFIAKKQ
jgi:hypothetical protein